MDILDLISSGIKENYKKDRVVKSYKEFLDLLQGNPEIYCRNSSKYILDVFNYYGNYPVKDIKGKSIKRWGLFDQELPVFGQEEAQNKIYGVIKSFSENRNNKIILLHGPNGSAKTSLIAAIMNGMEKYSCTDQGVMYTFNWIFSYMGDKETGIGFNSPVKKLESLAHVDPEKISFKLACPLKDNPILLLPVKYRIKLLESLNFKIPKWVKTAEMCQKCNEIYTQLMHAYQGDWEKILRHIQVERFYLSKKFRKGIVNIDAQRNTDADSRPLNIEQSYKIPPVLALSSMHEPYGDLVDANRGIVEFSELLKRNVEVNKYLLTTAEWQTISLSNYAATLDCVIFATDNQKNLSVFKHSLDWSSFNGRFAYVRVPYLLKWSEEKKSCEKLLSNLVSYKAPHTEDIISLWAVVSRLRTSSVELGNELNAKDKAVLYDRQQAPSKWRSDLKKTLLKNLSRIAEEYEDEQSRLIAKGIKDASYEGRSGASYRDLENIIITCNKKGRITPLLFIDYLKEVYKDNNLEFVKLHDPTRTDTQFELGYFSPEDILEELETYYKTLLQEDFRKGAGLVEEDQYLQLFKKYLKHVKAWLDEEKIFNANTNSYEEPDYKFLKSMEEKLEVDGREEHRRDMFNKLASWSIDNPEAEEIPYEKLFSEHLEKIKAVTYVEQKKQLRALLNNILLYQEEPWESLDKEERDLAEKTIQWLLGAGYTLQTIKEVTVYLIKN